MPRPQPVRPPLTSEQQALAASCYRLACREALRSHRAVPVPVMATKKKKAAYARKPCPDCGQACMARARRCQACATREQQRRRQARQGLCRHCQTRRVNRTRGLCWTCYHAPGVRQQYACDPVYGQQGHGANANGGYALPDRPTDTLPGSEERIRVLEQRAAQGVSLFHPDDSRREMSPTEERLPRAMLGRREGDGDEEGC